MKVLYGLSTSVGDPKVAEHSRSTATAEPCTEPSRSMVGVVEIAQQFHDLMWIDVAKIVKCQEWGHIFNNFTAFSVNILHIGSFFVKSNYFK